MDATQLRSFVQDAEGRLRALRSSILIHRQEGPAAGLDLQAAAVKGLSNRASRLGLRPLEMVLSEIEQESVTSVIHGQTLPDAASRTLLDLIARAEAEVLKLQVDAEPAVDLGDFLDNSFDFLQLDSPVEAEILPTQPVAEAEEEPEEDEFEPDEEMLEIFAMEAEDLLGNIETNLDLLSADRENREALWEVRRHAHTFKGAAGIIGLKKPSKLAHRIEDLLDHLSQNEIVPSPKVLELITAATNCLRTITKGDTSPGTMARTAEIYNSFDLLMAELTASPVETALPAEKVALPVILPEVQTAAPAEVPEGAQHAPRPIVRVSIARLDELVRIVRDLVVSRSMIEQRIAEFDAHLESLARTTRRLQAANARIETDFEASMLDTPGPLFFNQQRNNFRVDTEDQNAEFDSLELDRYTDFHESSRALSEATQDCFAVTTAFEALKGTLEAVFDDQRRLIEETQEKVMQIRLIRFGSIATRLQRAVRVTCEEENKRAEIVIENQDVEADTDLLDSLVEPLMHLIRNSVVHGIEPPETRRLVGKPETGRIMVRLTNEETHIELKVTDDGRGISGGYLKERALRSGLIDQLAADALDADDLVSLMFMPGLTTAEKLTMSAGRGVGMSIVKESIEARNGTISVETLPLQGTTFTVRIPLAFAVAQALLVRSNGNSAAVPLKVVKQVIELSPADLSLNEGQPVAKIDSIQCPVRYLSDYFSARRPDPADVLNALWIETGDEHFALVIDEIVKAEEIAIKPLGKPLDNLHLVLGAAVLGSGEVVPVLDAARLSRIDPIPVAAAPSFPEPELKTRVLVVDDSPSVRHMTSKVVTAAGWEAMTAKDGLEALDVLRGEILPSVILTDVEMPRMDGYELVSAIQKDDILREIPMVFITSRASEKHRERAAELGITEYLTKPFLEAELVGLVEKLCLQHAEPVI